MQELLVRCGLAAVFLGAALEGDVTLVLAGVAAHLDLVSLPAAIAAGALGGFTADASWYGVGWHRSRAIRTSRLLKNALPVIEEFMRRFGAWQILVCRFVYGTRVASMLFWGALRLPFARFAAIDLLGCLVWAGGLATAGYLLSGSAAALIGEVRRAEIWLLSAVAAAGGIFVLLHLMLRRRRARTVRGGAA